MPTPNVRNTELSATLVQYATVLILLYLAKRSGGSLFGVSASLLSRFPHVECTSFWQLARTGLDCVVVPACLGCEVLVQRRRHLQAPTEENPNTAASNLRYAQREAG